MKHLIVDAHEDIAFNMLSFKRDYRRPAHETRRLEKGSQTVVYNGDCLLGWPEYHQGGVGVIFSTIFAAPKRASEGEWDTVTYANQAEALKLYRQQLDLYHRLADEQPDYFRLIKTKKDLEAVVKPWQEGREDAPLGLVVLMEGAEAIAHPSELEEWWQRGLHILGPAWAGNRFCGGTREPGPLTPAGYELLDGMAQYGFVLDLSHMDAPACLQAIDHYPGRIIATHSNAITPIKGWESNRLLPDSVIRGILDRDGVIGIVPLNSFLKTGWRRGHDRAEVPLSVIANQIDYICQMAGSAKQVGLGTDFDGGFGVQSVAPEIDTIADLPKLGPLLQEKGYSDQDLEAIFGGNWLGVLRSTLPETR